MSENGASKPVAKRSLNDRELRVVNFIDQKFWETGYMPTYEVISDGTKESVAFIKNLIEKNSTARKSLLVRGIEIDRDEDAAGLTATQLMAANVMLNTHDKRSVREKLEFLGISSQQWHAWLRQPGFSQYMSKRAEAAFEANDWAAYEALRENVEEGKLDAVKFHFEMRGKYKQSVDVNVNIEQVLTRVVEVIARHVNDEEIILAIAEDIGQLTAGAQEIGQKQLSA